MPRHETDREDLMRDAAALRIRGEFRIADRDETVVAGCRDGGGWSAYFGQDPCYHFDPDGRLRRAFVRGRLYRTQGATLAELNRVRTPHATQLIRRDLPAPELNAFLNEMDEQFAALRVAFETGAATLVQAVPGDADVAGPFARFLTALDHSPRQLAPPIRTRPR